MNDRGLSRIDTITGTLRELAPGLEPAGYDAWTLNPSADAASRVVVRRMGEWLHFEMPDPGHEPRPPWEVVGAVGSGPGPGKAVFSPGAQSFHVRADVPAGLNGTLLDRCREAMASVRLVDALLRGHVKEGAGLPATPTTGGDENPSASLTELCEEAGWPGTERPTGEVVVNLKTGRGFHQAEVSAGPDGVTRIFAGLARFDSLSDASRAALGVFLLTAGRALRLVRPVIRERETGLTVGFEYQSCLPVTADDVDEALSALATAGQEFGKEAKALGDETLARRYLSVRG